MNRAAGTKQGAFGDIRFVGVGPRFDLPDNCKIKPSRDLTEPINRTGKARGEHQ